MFYEHKTRKTKTGLQTYLLLTYDRQFRSPIILKAYLLTFTYESIYNTYIVKKSVDQYILQLEVGSIFLLFANCYALISILYGL